jgi:hypothetical protein
VEPTICTIAVDVTPDVYPGFCFLVASTQELNVLITPTIKAMAVAVEWSLVRLVADTRGQCTVVEQNDGRCLVNLTAVSRPLVPSTIGCAS